MAPLPRRPSTGRLAVAVCPPCLHMRLFVDHADERVVCATCLVELSAYEMLLRLEDEW